jgi:excisionase family DNA binding protein
MTDLLTTKQLLELLQLDRTTVYRMLSEGRLPGFKVGGQWRFSRQEIETWMKDREPEPPPPARPSAEVLPLDCIQPVQDIFAEALNVGAVITQLDGEPITQISHCSPFCQLVLSSPRGRQRCIASWRSLAGQADHKPHLHTCHAGLMYARGRIEVAAEFVAMSFMGQFVTVRPDSPQGTPNGWNREAVISDLASDCGLDADALRAAAQEVYVVSPNDHPRLNRLLQKLTDTLSEIGCQRLTLLNKLRGIARLTEL